LQASSFTGHDCNLEPPRLAAWIILTNSQFLASTILAEWRQFLSLARREWPLAGEVRRARRAAAHRANDAPIKVINKVCASRVSRRRQAHNNTPSQAHNGRLSMIAGLLLSTEIMRRAAVRADEPGKIRGL